MQLALTDDQLHIAEAIRRSKQSALAVYRDAAARAAIVDTAHATALNTAEALGLNDGYRLPAFVRAAGFPNFGT